MYLLYSLGLALLLAVTLPYWVAQMLRHGKYRAGLGERLGRVPARLKRQAPGGRGAVWVHAVSVGEVLAVSGLVETMRREWPGRPVYLSTTTLSGQKLARERFGEDSVFYVPLDFAFALRPYLRAVRPELVVLAETEFWPNFLRLARASGARIAAVNARISDRSLPGYRRWRSLLRPVLAGVDLFLAQSEEDARRLVEIGADGSRVRVAGNLKFDVKAPEASALLSQLRAAISDPEHVLVCGSTVDGEERLLLEAFRHVLEEYPAALLVLAPRHPERFDEAAAAVAAAKLPLERRSRWNCKDPLRGGVFLLDSLGELASVYAVASIAFVGGSLVNRGGHNILEPARHGTPIVVGPYMQNFRDIAGIFHRAGALRIAQPASLRAELLRLLADGPERRELGRRAAEVFAAQAGATRRSFEALGGLLEDEPGSGEATEAGVQPAAPGARS